MMRCRVSPSIHNRLPLARSSAVRTQGLGNALKGRKERQRRGGQQPGGPYVSPRGRGESMVTHAFGGQEAWNAQKRTTMRNDKWWQSCCRVVLWILLGLSAVTVNAARIQPLANDHMTVFASPDPKRIFLYSPGIERLKTGRLVATMDVRGTKDVIKDWPAPISERPVHGGYWQGRIYTSDDSGETWTLRHRYPFMFARPFAAGGSLYLLGAAGDLVIIRSDDGGETWSEVATLTEGQKWRQAPCNVHFAHGNVYLVMERRVGNDIRGWYVGEVAPVLMRGKADTHLLARLAAHLDRPAAMFRPFSGFEPQPVDITHRRSVGRPNHNRHALAGPLRLLQRDQVFDKTLGVSRRKDWSAARRPA